MNGTKHDTEAAGFNTFGWWSGRRALCSRVKGHGNEPWTKHK